jgi:hypothetical protein
MAIFRQKTTRIDVSTRVGTILYFEGRRLNLESEIQFGGKSICIFEYSKPKWEPPFQDVEIAKEQYDELRHIVTRLLLKKGLAIDWKEKNWWT